MGSCTAGEAACYSHETLQLTDAAFRRVDCTFLLTMEGSHRRDRYMAQLQRFRPTERVVIVTNAGHRRCPKEGVVSPATDIWHANQSIAAIATRRAYEWILICEDDVEFTDDFRACAPVVEERVHVLPTDAPVGFNLGCMPFLAHSVGHGVHRVHVFGGAHAVLYNRRALQLFRDIRVRTFHDWEISAHVRMYCYDVPLAIQQFENSENQQRWDPYGAQALLFRLVRAGGTNEQMWRRYHATLCVGGGAAVLLSAVIAVALACTIVARLLRERRGMRSAA